MLKVMVMHVIKITLRVLILLLVCKVSFAQNEGVLAVPENTFLGDVVLSTGEGCPNGTEVAESSNVSFERQIVIMLNNLRTSNGLPPVKYSEELTAAARYHAKDMCEKNYFAHQSQDGAGNVTCQTFDRVGSFYTWTAAAENISAGFFDVQSAFNGWVNSTSHYNNMMSPLIYEVGIGYYYDASAAYVTRWVMDLGRRSNVYPVIINLEELDATTSTVQLYKYGYSGYNEMRLKNGNGNWGAWQPIANNLTWQLSGATNGVCMVYAEMRNSAGNILSSNDEINYSGGGTGGGGSTTTTQVTVKVKVFLQGCYNATTGSMNTNLRNSNLLPLTQPFNRPPWNYTGTESVATASAIPTNAVDWVLLEARNASDNYVVAETKACFLLSNGELADVSGTPSNGVNFNTLTTNGSYFLSVKTRNHLAVMSANTVSVPNSTILNLTQTANVMGGAPQLANMGGGIYAMLAGDMDGNGTVTVTDFNFFQQEMSIINNYVDSDCNMDKNVTVADFNLYSPNMSKIGVAQVRY
ncbi:hypothetical protein C7N43_37100 [Sphingobacteriales bacterium UPWRP_1]|nr:hypothetical protein B6N25_15840 [Sphingobacteriales bacterium TSM_CSS]PSJ71878.1 hypothetical protein C7N43_37100 [Sphingobacteriales bacterium UPWRP_1]